MLIRIAGFGLATAALVLFAFGALAQTPVLPGSLGVAARPLDRVELQRYGAGVALVGIAPGGAADQGGLKVGDVITAVDGKLFEGRNFATLMRGYPSGTKVSLHVFRSGRPFDLVVQLGQLVSDPAAWGVFLDLAGKKWLLEPDRRDILTFEWIGPDHLQQTLRPFGSTVGVYKMDVTYVAASRSLQLTYSWGERVPGTTAPDGSVTFHGKTQLFISDQRGFRRRGDGRIEYWVKHAGSQVHPLSPTDAAMEARMLEAQQERIAEEKRLAREKSERFNAAMGALYGALSEANEVAEAREAESRNALDATLAEAAAQAQGNAPAGQGTAWTQAAAVPSGQPLSQLSAVAAGTTANAPSTASQDSKSTEGGSWFVYCVALQPGAYLDAPGAVFLSAISTIDSLAKYNANSLAEDFSASVSAKYEAHPGSASCNVLRNRADAQRRWQEHRDSAGLSGYRKVETGLPAVQ